MPSLADNQPADLAHAASIYDGDPDDDMPPLMAVDRRTYVGEHADYQRGERYTNIDYVFASALRREEGVFLRRQERRWATDFALIRGAGRGTVTPSPVRGEGVETGWTLAEDSSFRLAPARRRLPAGSALHDTLLTELRQLCVHATAFLQHRPTSEAAHWEFLGHYRHYLALMRILLSYTE
ncbi:hypothetical protein C8R47DRAFT_1220478 [Mycena vitilis]|nr:hypothetical protein C8R47DRAFT_1220478 [Mycena vitilis]